MCDENGKEAEAAAHVMTPVPCLNPPSNSPQWRPIPVLTIQGDSWPMEAAFDGPERALQSAEILILSIQVLTKQERFKVWPLGRQVPISPQWRTIPALTIECDSWPTEAAFDEPKRALQSAKILLLSTTNKLINHCTIHKGLFKRDLLGPN